MNFNIGAPLTQPSPMVMVGYDSLSQKGNAQSKGGSTTIPATTRPVNVPSPLVQDVIQTNNSQSMAFPTAGLYLLGDKDQGGKVIGG